MDWILLAPRSTLQLKANLDDVIYKLDSDSTGIVKVSGDGVVRTQDVLGRDLIIVSVLGLLFPMQYGNTNFNSLHCRPKPSSKLYQLALR